MVILVPVVKCSNNKWRVGSGKCMYKSKASADRAYRGYLGKKYSKKGPKRKGK